MKAKTLMTAFCCALTMVSCSQDDMLTEDTSTSSVATTKMIGFNATQLDDQPATRALVTQDNFRNQTALVKVFRGDIHQTDLTLSYTSGRWTPSIKTPWYTNSTYKFFSAMPAEAPLSEDGTRILDIPGFIPAEEGTDYLYAAPVTTTSAYGMGRGVNFTFLHIYHKMKIKFAPISEEYNDYKLRVTSAKLWMPKEHADWDNKVGAIYAEGAVAKKSLAASEVTEELFNGYDLNTGATDEMEASQDFFLLSPAIWNSTNTTYVYLDVNYDVIDADGNVINSFTVTKHCIAMNVGTNVYDGCAYGGRSFTVNVNMSLSGKIKYAFFGADLEDWTEYDKEVTTP